MLVNDCPAYSSIQASHASLSWCACSVSGFFASCEANTCGGCIRSNMLGPYIWQAELVCWPLNKQKIIYTQYTTFALRHVDKLAIHYWRCLRVSIDGNLIAPLHSFRCCSTPSPGLLVQILVLSACSRLSYPASKAWRVNGARETVDLN